MTFPGNYFHEYSLKEKRKYIQAAFTAFKAFTPELHGLKD
jgi:hypothetical protein